MISTAQGRQIPRRLDPTHGKNSSLKVVQGVMHSRHSLSRRTSNRVEYTSNRGGRLKDQRKKQLVQRLFYLWIRKTFGRVNPSQARAHYERRVIRKAFEAWREEWWVTWREWRLCMRAECHYRYQLYNWVFISWRQFMAMQRECKDRLKMATIYADARRQRLAWERWLVYLEMQRIKRSMQETAQKHWEKTVLRSAWTLWCGCLLLQNRQCILEECAQQHWALSLQNRALLQWREVYLQACSLRKGEARSSLHYSHRLQSRALLAWASYLHYRQDKKGKKVLSKHARHCMVLRRCWGAWRDEFLHRQNERDAWQAAAALAQQRVQVLALHRWKGYTNLCLVEAKRNQFASAHYKRHLMRMGLRLLTLNISQRKAHQINNNVALQQYRRYVIAKYWHHWQERYEEIEEKNHQHKRDAALTHYSKTLLNSTLHCWRKRFAEHRTEQEMELRADCYYAQWALPQFFNSWKEYATQKHKTRERKETAEAHVWKSTCTWVFYTWLARSEEQRDTRLAERMAVLHADRTTLLQVFVHWRSRADLEREEREKCEASKRLYLHNLLHKTLWNWRDNIILIQSGRQNEQLAVRHDHLLCMQKAFTGWRKYVQDRREKKRRREKFDHHHHGKLLAHTLHVWKEFHHKARQANHIAEERLRLHHQNLLRKALHMWRENVAHLVRDKERECRASEQYKHNLLTKVLQMWREVTVHAIYSRHQQEEEVKVARTYLQGVSLQQIFQHWRKLGQEVRLERLNLEKARQNHQAALLHRCFAAWIQYCHQNRHREVMQRQANCLLQHRTCLCYFTLWKRQLQLRYEEAERTDVALWHWSFKLLAKVMEAWKCWVLERHRKRDRLALAAQFHRDQLLREGVAHILSHTEDMRSFRSSLALQSQEQCARRLQSVVRRCALLWKQRVLGQPGGSRGKSHKKRVSFCPPLPISTLGSTGEDGTVGRAIDHGAAHHSSDQLFFACKSRLQPRRPDHLLNSLDKESACTSTHDRAPVLSSPPSTANPIEKKNQAIPLASDLFCSHATAQEPQMSHQNHSTNQAVLLPPSSFVTSGVYRQHSTSSLMAQAGISKSDILLSPKNFTMCQAAAPPGSVCKEVKLMECLLVDQQPHCHTSPALANELLSIQQKMHHFQREKRQLQAWRRLAEVLRSWLLTSWSEDDTECHSTRQELEELEARMKRLATWLEEEKPVMQCYAARIHSISNSLQESNH